MPTEQVYPGGATVRSEASPDLSPLGGTPELIPLSAVNVLSDLLVNLPGAIGCCAYLPAHKAAVFVFSDQRQSATMTAVSSLSELPGIFLAAVSNAGNCHLASVPLRLSGSPSDGHLLVALPAKMRLGRLDRQLLASMAGQFAAVLEAALLRDETARLRESLGAAVQIHRLLGSGLDMEDLLAAGLEPITQMVGATGAGVLLYDPATEELVLQKPAFNIVDDALIDQYRVRVEPRDESFTAVRVFVSGQPIANNDPLKTPQINRQFIRLYGVRNSATLPLMVEHRTIGVLHLINKAQGPFTTDDLQLLELVASQLAVLLENARLMMQLRRREQEAKLLYDLGMEIVGSPELDQILSSVVEKSRYLVRAELASISLLDRESGYGTVRVAAGDHHGTLRQVNFYPSAGTAAQVLRQHRPLMRSLQHAGLEMDNLDMVARSAGFTTVLAVPLISDGQVFGLLHAWRKSPEPFTGAETELLNRLSVQAAIAVDKARRYDEQRRALAELRRLNGLIEAQHGLLKRAQAVHREMTALVLEGKGYRAVTETLSQLVGSPVAVLDRFQRVLSLSQPAEAASDAAWERLRQASVPGGASLTRQEPAEASDRALAAALRGMADHLKPVQLPPSPEHGRDLPRLMAPIMVEHEVLGTISILQNRQNFQDIDFVAVEQAATVCALVMLKEKTALEVEYRLKGDLLFDLCRGRYQSEKDFMHRAAVLGYDLNRPRAVLLLEFDPGDEGQGEVADALSRVRRILDLVRAPLQEFVPDGLVAAQGESVLILAPEGSVPTKVLAEKLQARVNSLLGQPVSIGVGSTCHALTDYARSFKEARQALVIARRQGAQSQVSAFADLGIYRVLFQVPDSGALKDFVHHTLGDLIEYDRQHKTPLLHTLDQFLRHHGNRQATCRAVFVHINTLNYRLRRIEEILNVSLDSHADRLNLDLALRILETMARDALANPAK